MTDHLLFHWFGINHATKYGANLINAKQLNPKEYHRSSAVQ